MRSQGVKLRSSSAPVACLTGNSRTGGPQTTRPQWQDFGNAADVFVSRSALAHLSSLICKALNSVSARRATAASPSWTEYLNDNSASEGAAIPNASAAYQRDRSNSASTLWPRSTEAPSKT